MIYFTSDYCEGCHERILERMQLTNFDQNPVMVPMRIARKPQLISVRNAAARLWMYISWWVEHRPI